MLPDYRKRIRIYLVILVALTGIFLLINTPQCPEHFTQEQVDASRCVVGANIGLGLYLLLGTPAFFIVLGLLIVALHRQRGRSMAGDRPMAQPDEGTAVAIGGGEGLGSAITERPASQGALREDP